MKMEGEWGDISYKPRNTWSHLTGKGGERFSPRACRGNSSPADTLISGFWPPELKQKKICCFQPLNCW